MSNSIFANHFSEQQEFVPENFALAFSYHTETDAIVGIWSDKDEKVFTIIRSFNSNATDIVVSVDYSEKSLPQILHALVTDKKLRGREQ